jgi:hypothetical protein
MDRQYLSILRTLPSVLNNLRPEMLQANGRIRHLNHLIPLEQLTVPATREEEASEQHQSGKYALYPPHDIRVG